MVAIITTYKGPTNTKGARVVAREPEGKRCTMTWRHDLEALENHRIAALTLMRRLGWGDHILTGTIKNGFAHIVVQNKE